MSSLDFPGLGALVVDPPDDQIYDCDDDEGGYEASHDADLMRSPRAGVKRARRFVIGHCEDWERMEVRAWSYSVSVK